MLYRYLAFFLNLVILLFSYFIVFFNIVFSLYYFILLVNIACLGLLLLHCCYFTWSKHVLFYAQFSTNALAIQMHSFCHLITVKLKFKKPTILTELEKTTWVYWSLFFSSLVIRTKLVLVKGESFACSGETHHWIYDTKFWEA